LPFPGPTCSCGRRDQGRTHQPKRPNVDESVTANLPRLAGANTCISTISAYRIDLAQFVDFLQQTNCTIASLADVIRSTSLST
jgi:hypothetical protein